MDSLYYLAALIAILLVARWYTRADRSDETARTEGLFGMRKHVPKGKGYRAEDDA